MNEVDSLKYLGLHLAATVEKSIETTVNQRIGLATRAVFEIRTVIENTRAECIGAIETGMNLFESSVLPMILFGSESWGLVDQKVLQKLDSLNVLFLASILGVSRRGTPAVSLYLETASLKMENRILLNQLLFYHFLITLSNDSLAKEFFLEQKKESFPSLFNQCEQLLTEWSINTETIHFYTKNAWKNKMKQLIKRRNHLQLIEWCKSYKKIDFQKYVNNDFEMQPYLKDMNLCDSRTIF